MSHTNRLIHETSPYLRQHAHNPVDWFPWGPEALEKSKSLNKPIFLSVGYSACHWCHVMEHESFENETIAQLMNDHFVCIKVDREERPDIDHIYMMVVQMMTGHGGWPMSVFLTPDLKPIFGGTYFPPSEHSHMPSFPRILKQVAEIYRQNPPELKTQTDQVVAALQDFSKTNHPPAAVQIEQLLRACELILDHHDPEYGGLEGAPKFPQASVFSFLLRGYVRTKKESYRKVLEHTLTKMAQGGIYDHLGGGFARYSVDDRWAVPHFEKMLYDNAQLASLYFQTYQVTRTEFFREVGEDILQYVLREMTLPEGGFYSAQDADSEGEEGKFYVWDPAEIKNILGEKEGAVFCQFFGVTESGNFEHGKTVLAMRGESTVVPEAIRLNKQKLYEARKKRIAPGLDDKILTSWNALMISAFVRGFEVTQKKQYLTSAENCARFILKNLVEPKQPERLLVTTKGDAPGKLKAYLDDYAFFISALLDLFAVTGEEVWLDHALLFQGTINEHFDDAQNPGFYFTADDHEKLLDRSKAFYDGAIPSGNAVALDNCCRLRPILGREAVDLQKMTERHLQGLFGTAAKRPLGMTHILSACDRFLGPSQEVVLVGSIDDVAFKEMRQWLDGHPWFNGLKVYWDGKKRFKAAGLNELLTGKVALQGKPTVYICENFSCKAPITDLETLREFLVEDLQNV